jgi:hypothetical protein
MSTVEPQRGTSSAAPGAPVREYVEDDPGSGWVLFAGTLLVLLAIVNFIDGIAAVSDSTFFVGDAKFVISNLNTWGWVLVGISVVQLFVALGVWMQVTGIRWLGVAIASINAIVQLIFMPSYPFWALCLFTLDILVIYGLVAHGARPRSTV